MRSASDYQKDNAVSPHPEKQSAYTEKNPSSPEKLPVTAAFQKSATAGEDSGDPCVETVELKSPFNLADWADDKETILDVKVSDSTGSQYTTSKYRMHCTRGFSSGLCCTGRSCTQTSRKRDGNTVNSGRARSSLCFTNAYIPKTTLQPCKQLNIFKMYPILDDIFKLLFYRTRQDWRTASTGSISVSWGTPSPDIAATAFFTIVSPYSA